jgi:predicted branched-subunit amino acid permease
LLTDEAFATDPTRSRRGNKASPHWYSLATGLALWTTWQISTALGILLGGGIPASIPLAFAITLTFIALLIPTLIDRPTVIAATSAGILAVILSGLPLRLGLLIGALAGVGIGVWADWKSTIVEY